MCFSFGQSFVLTFSLSRLKWKPPSENSIDFKLVLRFPALPDSSKQPDLHAKPVFALHVWCGGEGTKATYEPWDTMHVNDEEWERYVATRAQLFRFLRGMINSILSPV